MPKTTTKKVTKKITKTDLIAQIATISGQSKSASESFLADFITAITNNLKEGNEVVITGFGSFRVSRREEREGRNPQNGNKVTVPAYNAVAFKAGNNLKRDVQ